MAVTCSWKSRNTRPKSRKPTSGTSNERPKMPCRSLKWGKNRTTDDELPSWARQAKRVAASTITRVRPTSSVVSIRVTTKKVVTNPIATPR